MGSVHRHFLGNDAYSVSDDSIRDYGIFHEGQSSIRDDFSLDNQSTDMARYTLGAIYYRKRDMRFVGKMGDCRPCQQILDLAHWMFCHGHTIVAVCLSVDKSTSAFIANKKKTSNPEIPHPQGD